MIIKIKVQKKPIANTSVKSQVIFYDIFKTKKIVMPNKRETKG